MLHDIDLTATGPSGLADVLAQHPERGPDPARTRDLDPRLDEPVPERYSVPGDQPRGGVPAAAVPPAGQFWVDPPDHQGQIPGPVQGGIARLIGVILQFLVSPPGSAGLGLPGPAVRRGSRGAIELIRPCQPVRAFVDPAAHARLPICAPDFGLRPAAQLYARRIS